MILRMDSKKIVVAADPGEQPSQAAARAAWAAGTRTVGNMRWHGDYQPCLEIGTEDGRVVRVMP